MLVGLSMHKVSTYTWVATNTCVLRFDRNSLLKEMKIDWIEIENKFTEEWQARVREKEREREREMAAAVDQFFYTTAVSGIIIY